MGQRVKATVTMHVFGAECRFPYNPWVVEQLKLQIPIGCRAWNASGRYWSISSNWVDRAIEILEQAFGVVEVIGRQEATSAGARSVGHDDPDYAELHLLPSAPRELVTAAYRCLARLHHPDTGGDTRRMQAINGAYDRLRTRGVA